MGLMNFDPSSFAKKLGLRTSPNQPMPGMEHLPIYQGFGSVPGVTGTASPQMSQMANSPMNPSRMAGQMYNRMLSQIRRPGR